MNKHTHISKKKGFAMLFAVLVSSVLISIGISIFNITIKELSLSSSGRESQFAFYAADTGMECALYWDFKANTPSIMFAYSTSTESEGQWRNDLVAAEDPNCVASETGYLAGQFNTPDLTTPGVSITTFQLEIPNTNASVNAPYCTKVTVRKDQNVALGQQTTIESRGYNAGCSDVTNQNTIERALRVVY